MLEINKTHVGDTIETMKLIDDKSVQLIVTSPPYRASVRKDNHKYPDAKDVVNDDQTEEEYIEWMVDIFKQYERVLKDNGSIAFNISYTTFAPSLPYQVINAVFQNTGLMISDTLAWKKNSCVPLSGHPTAMTRIVEPVYIFVKKDFFNKTKGNKLVKSISDTGQKYFTSYFNYLEAKNNDGKVKGHDATYSTEFASYFIDLYSSPKDLVLDNFMGTGTTGVACKELDRNYIGIDLFPKYVEYAETRIKNHEPEYDLYVTLKDDNGSEEVKPIYYKNLPKSGDNFLISGKLKKVDSVININGKTTINLIKEKINEDVIEKYTEYYSIYDNWINSRNISDEEKEYVKDDLTSFLRFVKRCKKDKNLWEKVKQI